MCSRLTELQSTYVSFINKSLLNCLQPAYTISWANICSSQNFIHCIQVTGVFFIAIWENNEVLHVVKINTILYSSMKYFAYLKVSVSKRFFFSDLQKANVLTILSKIILEKHHIPQVNLLGSLQGHSMVTFVTKIWEFFTFNWSQLLQQTSYQSFCGSCTKYLGWSIHSNPQKN